MTNPLEILKTQLEKALDETSETEDFKDSLRDSLYSCELGSIASLESFIGSWVNSTDLSEEDKQYQQGVQFVEEKWHAITGMF